jgi:hypothetical protein
LIQATEFKIQKNTKVKDMPNAQVIDFPSMYSSAVGSLKKEVYGHRVRNSDAVIDLYAKAGKMSKLKGHDEIMKAVMNGAMAYLGTLQELPANDNGVSAKYRKGEVMMLLQRQGLDEESIVDMVRSGRADEVLMTMSRAFNGYYGQMFNKAAYQDCVGKNFGADRYGVEKSLAGEFKKATGNSAPVEKVTRDLESMLLQEAVRQIDLAPPQPVSRAA